MKLVKIQTTSCKDMSAKGTRIIVISTSNMAKMRRMKRRMVIVKRQMKSMSCHLTSNIITNKTRKMNQMKEIKIMKIRIIIIMSKMVKKNTSKRRRKTKMIKIKNRKMRTRMRKKKISR